MIKITNLTKFYPSALGPQYVFKDLNFTFPRDKNIALLGQNGAGKSTLFRLIAGSEYPNKGTIQSEQHISWPVGLTSGVHPYMTGRENVRFIGRVNGVADLAAYEARVLEFTGLGVKFDLPVKSYSSGMRTRLAFGCSVGVDFDIYLIDEATSVGDMKFRRHAKEALYQKSKQANVIMVSHDVEELRTFCDSAVVVVDGKLQYFDDLETGLSFYQGEDYYEPEKQLRKGRNQNNRQNNKQNNRKARGERKNRDGE